MSRETSVFTPGGVTPVDVRRACDIVDARFASGEADIRGHSNIDAWLWPGLLLAAPALAALHRALRATRYGPMLLTLCAPLPILLLLPPAFLSGPEEPTLRDVCEDYLFVYTLLLVLSGEALAISRALTRRVWPQYLAACVVLSLFAWGLSACTLSCLPGS